MTAGPGVEGTARGESTAGRACAVIVAAGTGSRFGNPDGKLLVTLAGRPLLAWTVAACDRAASIGCIVMVCASERRAQMEAALASDAVATPLIWVGGGATRQESTAAGVAAVPAGFDVIAVHDGARPLVEPSLIDEAVEALRADPALDGVVCGQPAVDTLKEVDADGVIRATPDRARLWTVQTPQVFRRAPLERALARAAREGFVGTDDASVVEHAGGRVRVLAAPRDNMKVTVPEDLLPAEAILRARGEETRCRCT